MVARAGVQPATFALGVRCSMQLSYRAMTSSVSRVRKSKGNRSYAEGAAVALMLRKKTAARGVESWCA